MPDGKADLHEVLKAYGIAMVVAQLLEKTLHSSVAFMARLEKVPDPGNPFSLLVEESRRTMGMLVKRLRQYQAISDDVETALRTVVDRRNELAHRFFLIKLHLIGSVEGCARLIEELQQATVEFMIVQKVITEATLAAMAATGGSPDLSPTGRMRFGEQLEHDVKFQEALQSMGFTREAILHFAKLAQAGDVD